MSNEMVGKMMLDDFEQEVDEKKIILKKNIKSVGSNCAKIILILAISTYGIAFTITFFMKMLDVILSSIANGGVNSSFIPKFSLDTYNFFAGYLPCILGDIIAIIIAVSTTGIRIKQHIFTKIKATKKFIFLGTISCIGTGMVSSILYLIYATILKGAGITIPQPDFSFPKQNIYLVLFLMYVCLIGPILEEIIFRGFILNSLKRYGNLTAIIVSSILFSMFHLNLVQFVNPILMGIVLAFIAIKSESIIPSIIAHVFNNTITFIMSGITIMNSPLVEGAIEGIYLFVGVIALILFIYNFREDFMEVIREDTAILSTQEKVRVSFSGGWAVAYIIFYVAFIVITMISKNLIK
nr:CPBP family intramembrane glutamic endopeptidase [Clostridium chromiireducens]